MIQQKHRIMKITIEEKRFNLADNGYECDCIRGDESFIQFVSLDEIAKHVCSENGFVLQTTVNSYTQEIEQEYYISFEEYMDDVFSRKSETILSEIITKKEAKNV